MMMQQWHVWCQVRMLVDTHNWSINVLSPRYKFVEVWHSSDRRRICSDRRRICVWCLPAGALWQLWEENVLYRMCPVALTYIIIVSVTIMRRECAISNVPCGALWQWWEENVLYRMCPVALTYIIIVIVTIMRRECAISNVPRGASWSVK